MSLINFLRRLGKKSKKNQSYSIDKIVFDLEWNREVLILHDNIQHKASILVLDITPDMDIDMQSTQMVHEEMSDLLEKLQVHLQSIRLFKDGIQGTRGDCHFKIGGRIKRINLPVNEAISLALVHKKNIQIMPELLESQKQNRFSQDTAMIPFDKDIIAGNVKSYFENEVIM